MTAKYTITIKPDFQGAAQDGLFDALRKTLSGMPGVQLVSEREKAATMEIETGDDALVRELRRRHNVHFHFIAHPEA